MIPRYQLDRSNLTTPSTPRSDAAIPRRDWSREDSTTPMASKYRRIVSTSRENLLDPGSSDGKCHDMRSRDQGSKRLAIGKGS